MRSRKAIVGLLYDEQDIHFIKAYGWHLDSEGYVVHNGYKLDVRTLIRLHRIIVDAQSGQQVDHINGNKLDNRRSNLRICVNAENCRNTVGKSTRKSKFKNVRKKGNRWEVNICANKKCIYIGMFPTELLAHEAAVRACNKHHKKFSLHLRNLE